MPARWARSVRGAAEFYTNDLVWGGAGYTVAPASSPGEPHPSTTAVWLVEQEAAGRHELVDAVMTNYLSVDLPARAVVLAQVTGHLLRLVDGPGAYATLRSHTARDNH